MKLDVIFTAIFVLAIIFFCLQDDKSNSTQEFCHPLADNSQSNTEFVTKSEFDSFKNDICEILKKEMNKVIPSCIISK